MVSTAYKAFINFEKEEAWLNEMASKGMNFIHYSFIKYLFEDGKPGEYTYRLELLKELPSHPESRAYIRFMEESGVECVCTYLRWAYFRKKTADGPFSIYTDADSKISHFKRIAWLMGVLCLANLITGLSNLGIGLFNGINFGMPFNAYFSVLNLSLAVLLAFLFFSYIKRMRKLKKEKALHE